MLLSDMLKGENKPLNFGIKLIRLEHNLDNNKIDYCTKEGNIIFVWTDKNIQFLDKYNYEKIISPSGFTTGYKISEVI